MYNWSVDTSQFDKNSDQYKIWRLEQLINYGLGGEKLDRGELKKYLPRLRIDLGKRCYLESLLRHYAKAD
jgi:hypothetical protein